FIPAFLETGAASDQLQEDRVRSQLQSWSWLPANSWSGPAPPPCASIASSANPQLGEERPPLRVVLVVADPGRLHLERHPVCERDPSGPVGEVTVDLGPEAPGCLRIARLERLGVGDLSIDCSVAELGGVRVLGADGYVAGAGQRRDDHAGRWWCVVGVPAAEDRLVRELVLIRE